MYTGVKIQLSYVMRNKATGAVVAEASSAHCFTDASGKPVAVKKTCPELDGIMKSIMQEA